MIWFVLNWVERKRRCALFLGEGNKKERRKRGGKMKWNWAQNIVFCRNWTPQTKQEKKYSFVYSTKRFLITFFINNYRSKLNIQETPSPHLLDTQNKKESFLFILCAILNK